MRRFGYEDLAPREAIHRSSGRRPEVVCKAVGEPVKYHSCRPTSGRCPACGFCAALIGVVPQPLVLRATPRQSRPSPSRFGRGIDKGTPGLLDVENPATGWGEIPRRYGIPRLPGCIQRSRPGEAAFPPRATPARYSPRNPSIHGHFQTTHAFPDHRRTGPSLGPALPRHTAC